MDHTAVSDIESSSVAKRARGKYGNFAYINRIVNAKTDINQIETKHLNLEGPEINYKKDCLTFAVDIHLSFYGL